MSNSRYADLQSLHELKSVDAIKMSLAARCAMKALSANNADFRLYKLLKNNSRFFRITGASNHGIACVSDDIDVKFGGG